MSKKQELERQLKETENQMELLQIVGIVIGLPFFGLIFINPIGIFIFPIVLLFLFFIGWQYSKLTEKRDNLRLQLSSIRGYQLPKPFEKKMITWKVFLVLILSGVITAVIVGLTYF